MRPLAVLLAILFGSATAISFGLIATSVVFLLLKGEHPELARELTPLLVSCIWFLTLAGASGAALYATLKTSKWERAAQCGAGIALIAVIVAYWPRT